MDANLTELPIVTITFTTTTITEVPTYLLSVTYLFGQFNHTFYLNTAVIQFKVTNLR